MWRDPIVEEVRAIRAAIAKEHGNDLKALARALRRKEGADGLVIQRSIVEHQLIGHADFAGSFWDRLQLSASLPVTFLERGEPALGISPITGPAAGDPRLGASIRIFSRAA